MYIFQVEAKATGWVSLGLSHTKSIKGADLVIGWVEDDGKATLKDFHSIDGRVIEEDQSQDHELIVGYETEGITVLRFKRKVISGSFRITMTTNLHIFIIHNIMSLFKKSF